MDIDTLTKLVDFFTGKGHPIMIILTMAQHSKEFITTARENIIPIFKRTTCIHIRSTMIERTLISIYSECKGFWFHVDGALGDVYTPFIELGH